MHVLLWHLECNNHFLLANDVLSVSLKKGMLLGYPKSTGNTYYYMSLPIYSLPNQKTSFFSASYSAYRAYRIPQEIKCMHFPLFVLVGTL